MLKGVICITLIGIFLLHFQQRLADRDGHRKQSKKQTEDKTERQHQRYLQADDGTSGKKSGGWWKGARPLNHELTVVDDDGS